MVARKFLLPVKNFPIRGCSLSKAERVALVRKALAAPYLSGKAGARTTTVFQEVSRILKSDKRK